MTCPLTHVLATLIRDTCWYVIELSGGIGGCGDSRWIFAPFEI